MKVCLNCGAKFEGRGNQRYCCNDCRTEARAEQVRQAHRNETVRRGGLPDVGKGGFQWGERNPKWNGGTQTYRDIAKGEYGEACGLCGSTRHVRAHHIDENRRNNNPDNLIMLCQSCHRSVHALCDAEEKAR